MVFQDHSHICDGNTIVSEDLKLNSTIADRLCVTNQLLTYRNSRFFTDKLSHKIVWYTVLEPTNTNKNA